MISSEAFVLSLGLVLGGLATWAFKCLPDERWQFLASVPILKDSSGRCMDSISPTMVCSRLMRWSSV